ncbi:MAG: SAM-dependent methyltransferase, partial [Cyanobacteria bacterium J06627_15]
CLSGWPSQSFFDADYQLTTVSEVEYEVLKACDVHTEATDFTVRQLVAALSVAQAAGLATVRELQSRQLILLQTA